MIFDTIDQSDRYLALSPRFATAFNFLKNMTDDVDIGRHDIEGDDIYAIVQCHDTTPVETKQYEVHRRYIDVQYIHRGYELIYWTPLESLKNEMMAYSDEHDAELYAYDQIGTPFTIGPGQFSILFPSDAHIPSCTVASPEKMLKVVIKVRID